ncbi:AAA family ATPase [Syntrophotalea acetylenica]|uniref:AAA family ATPase n=1 Tax=Syntrophotalea acetylenica TaxID=29542 RepID=UPI002A35B1B6|nr:AAA family ATPase [Syntrophotalea acetylenica]MDY0263511.1 AAA family ATPase [Syntrophotalea acetylenica]
MILDSVRYSDMLKPRQKAVYLVHKLITERTINIFYGFPGSKKSLVVADMAMAIATGQNFAPNMPGQPTFEGYKTIKTPVLWMDYENGEDLSFERFTAFGKAYQADPGINLMYSCLPKLSKVNAQISLLITEIKNMPIMPGVIVIDTLLRFAKVKDENSSEMDQIMSTVRRLVDELDVTIFLISHSTKITGTRAGNSLRGHSSIEGGVDAQFRVNGEHNSDIVEIEPQKARRNPVDPINLRWTYQNDSDDQLTEARFYYEPCYAKATQANLKKQAINERIQKDLLNALDKLGAMSKNELIKQVGGNRQKAREIIDDLENILAIKVTPDGKAFKCEITTIGRGLL